MKCCEAFKCTFKSHALCQKPEPNDDCDVQKDINMVESPKHDRCCKDEKYKDMPGCAKCNSKVFEDA